MEKLKTFEQFIQENEDLNEGTTESREEYQGLKYHVMHQVPKGYYVKGADSDTKDIFDKVKTVYFDKHDEAKQHAEMEIDGYLEEGTSTVIESKENDILIESFGEFLLNEAKAIKEDEEDGLSRAGHFALGMKQVRIVISSKGKEVENEKDKILKIILKNDPKSKAEFYDKTGKIVGTFAKAKMDGLKRDLRTIDSKIEVEIKNQTLK